MGRPFAQVNVDLEQFSPHQSTWARLEDLVREVLASEDPLRGADPLLQVFERYPGVMSGGADEAIWSVIHGLEVIPGYEQAVIRSLQRRPSILAARLIDRMLNADIERVDNISFMDLLQQAAGNPACSRTVHNYIAEVVERHQPAPPCRQRGGRWKRGS